MSLSTNCGTTGAVPGNIDLGAGNTGFVWVRNDTWMRAQPIGELFQSAPITVQCQVTGGNYLATANDTPSPNGSELWYRIKFNGQTGYVPAPQVKLAIGAKAAICL